MGRVLGCALGPWLKGMHWASHGFEPRATLIGLKLGPSTLWVTRELPKQTVQPSLLCAQEVFSGLTLAREMLRLWTAMGVKHSQLLWVLWMWQGLNGKPFVV